MKSAEVREHPWYLSPFVAGIAWVMFFGVIDWLTGPELSLSVFYLPAVIWVAWFSGRWPAIGMAACAALTWLIAQVVGDASSNPLILGWNAFVRFGFFLVTAVLTSEVMIRRRAEADLLEQRGILRSILDSMNDGVAVVSRKGIIISFNPAAEQLFGSNALGLAAAEWLAEVEESALTGFASESSKIVLRRALRGEFYGSSEMSLRHPKRRELLRLGLTVLPLLEAGRGKRGSVIVINDLTERRELERQISEVSEREQRRIGQDLHDGLCQHLVGVALAAGSLQADLESLGMMKHAAAAGEIAGLINEGVGQARNLAHGLYPVGLEDGLDTALDALARATRKRTGVACEFRRCGPQLRQESVTTMHLYRIAQECLSNAIRHASPKHIWILLEFEDQMFRLSITDDGCGIDPASASRGGIGLQIMKYRANLIGGKLDMESSPDKGTRITCTAPCLPSIHPIQ